MRRALALSLAVMLGAAAAGAETIDVGGAARSYLTQFPEAKPAPLVIVLHGNTQTGADMRTGPRGRWSPTVSALA